ncbi:MAG: SWIM zinc finger family protein [Syntrophales bacterium]
MTGQETAKRNEKAQNLRVWQVEDTWFYVESDERKICYKVCISDQGDHCSCGDFAQRSNKDPQFKCKHILAVMNSIPRNEVMEAQILEKRKSKLDERFIKTIDGKDFVLYAGLLDLAHQKNLISIDVELLQYPTKENDHTAVCKAIAKTTAGANFVDVGDANPQNCNAKVAKHIIRMSSTRAKARCLRDLTNIGMTCLEELGDFNEVIGEEETVKSIKKDNVKKFPGKQAKVSQSGNGDGNKTTESAGKDNGEEKTHGETPAPVETQGDKKPEKEVKSAEKDTKPSRKSGNGNGKSKEKQIPMMSEAQKNALFNLSRRRGISVEELENLAMKTFNIPLENLTSADASTFIRTLQQSA